MNLVRDAWVMCERELLRYGRDRFYWLGQLLFPLLFVGSVGLGLNRVVTLPSGINYVSHLASGILALLAASGGVGAGMSLIQDRASGFLRSLAVAPIARGSLVIGKLAARLVVTCLLFSVLLFVLALFTPLRIPNPLIAFCGVASITSVFFSLGLVLASWLRNLESFRGIAAVITLPLYLLSGIFYPVETLPRLMQLFSRINPLSYGVDLLRYGVLGVHEAALAYSLGLALLFSVLATVAAVASFEYSQDRLR